MVYRHNRAQGSHARMIRLELKGDHARVISIAPGENCGLEIMLLMKFWGVLVI